VITLATPTPRGLAIMCVFCDSALKKLWEFDLKKIVDYVGLSYFGNLEEWRGFLGQEDFLFGSMKGISLSYEENASLDLRTRDYSVRLGQDLMNITDRTNLFLGFSVFPKAGEIVLDLRKTIAEQDDTSGANNYCVLYRWSKPDDALPDASKDEWNKCVLAQGYPYNAKAYAEQGRSNIGVLHPSFTDKGKVSVPEGFAYTAFLAKEGSVPDGDMARYLQEIIGSMVISRRQ
jgi:hypothetical protein